LFVGRALLALSCKEGEEENVSASHFSDEVASEAEEESERNRRISSSLAVFPMVELHPNPIPMSSVIAAFLA
jgi:hypothetical protein